MQGMNIYGLVLALTSLSKCSADPDAYKPFDGYFLKNDDGDGRTDPGFGLEEMQNSLKSVLDLNLTQISEKSILESVGNILSNVIFKNSSYPAKKLPEIKKEKFFNKDNATERRSARKKRQAGTFGIGIPTLQTIYRGSDESTDFCERDEILHVDGECHQLLSQGPCEDTEYVLMDAQTKKGYCAARLCSPDRVFVFGDQRCHDPFEEEICPPGRRLLTTGFGTPACGCPAGTYEEEDDDDEDVCQPILGKIENCEAGEVFWFRSFRSIPECLPDPCKGINSRKSPNEPPYVPSIFDGKCYQLGQQLLQCSDDTRYTLSFHALKGICASLEDANFLEVDEEILDLYSRLYGKRLSRGVTSAAAFNAIINRSGFVSSDVSIGSSVVPRTKLESPIVLGQSIMHKSSSSASAEEYSESLPTSHASAHSTPIAIRPNPSSPLLKLFESVFGKSTQPKRTIESNESEEPSKEKKKDYENERRKKRDTLQHAAPQTVFQAALAACRSGTRRGINFKCSYRYLPSESNPLVRPKRSVSPLAPFPPCPKGTLYSITRKCVSSSGKVRTSILASGLG